MSLVLAEGLAVVFERHKDVHLQLLEALDELAIAMVVEPQARLPQLNAVRVPRGIDEARLRGRLLDEFGIEIGAGLGALAGKVWRIGLMGHSARSENVEKLTEALKIILNR